MSLLGKDVKMEGRNAKAAHKNTFSNAEKSLNKNRSQNFVAPDTLVKSCELKELRITLERLSDNIPHSENLHVAESHSVKKQIPTKPSFQYINIKNKETGPEINISKKSKKEITVLNDIKNVPVTHRRNNNDTNKVTSCNAKKTLRVCVPNIRTVSDIYKIMVDNQVKIVNMPDSLYIHFKKGNDMTSKNSVFNNIYVRKNKGNTSLILKKRKSSLPEINGEKLGNSKKSPNGIINGLSHISIDDSGRLIQLPTKNHKSQEPTLKKYKEEIPFKNGDVTKQNLDHSVNDEKFNKTQPTRLIISSSLWGIPVNQYKVDHPKQCSGLKKKSSTSMKEGSRRVSVACD